LAQKAISDTNWEAILLRTAQWTSKHQSSAFIRLLNDPNLRDSEAVLQQLCIWLNEQNINLTVAIDEAQILCNPLRYLSLAALGSVSDDDEQHISLMMGKGIDPRLEHGRGILSIFVNKISNQISLVISGTTFSLGRMDLHFRVHRFPYFNSHQEVWERL